MDSIYLDHNAATPIRSEVVEAMARCYAEVYANPASAHRPGQQARQALEDARERIAQILDADLAPPRRDRLVFTSGGTEANNLAILGIARAQDSPLPPNLRSVPGEGPGERAGQLGLTSSSDSKRIIISAAEHQSVIEPAEHLLEQGWRLDTLGLTSAGVVRTDPLAAMLAEGVRPDLVSVQLANHETGVLQPIGELAAMCNRAGVPLHTDAVAAVGKVPVSFRALNVAAMSVTAHKFQGPLGIGALVLRDGVPLSPLMFGGHQQAGLRPGTESAALAVGMAKALELWQREQVEHARRLRSLLNRFEAGLRGELPNVVIHGTAAARLPQTCSVAFPGLDGQILLMALDLAGVACSVGSACSSGSTELSPTLRAMDLPNALVSSSLRFSLGATTTETQVDEALRRIVHVCRELL
jgi:cysteine desulfurase